MTTAALAGVTVALALATTAPAKAAPLLDILEWSAPSSSGSLAGSTENPSDESLGFGGIPFVTPTTGVLFLTEPVGVVGSIITNIGGQDVSSSRISDAVVLRPTGFNNLSDLWLISDGADQSLLDSLVTNLAILGYLTETGSRQDVSSYFGLAGGSIVVQSDTSDVSATPLPSTWLMLLSGFVGLGFFAYRGSKKHSAAFAAA